MNNPTLGGAISVGAGLLGQMGNSVISGGLQSGAGSAIGGIGNAAGDIVSAIPGLGHLAGGIVKLGSGLIGGLANRMFGSKMNQENIAKVEGQIGQLNSFQSDASDFGSLVNNWSNAPSMAGFNNSYIGKDGWFSNKAKKKANALREDMQTALAFRDASLANNAQNLIDEQVDNLLANYAAYGGNLFSKGGGIHIKPENKGKFNALKKRTGKTTEELTHSKNPLTRKRAIFAQNARKWKHGDGGNLFDDGGYTWQDGVKDAASYLPIVGTVMDAYDFYKEPSWENAGYLGLSLLSEVPFLKPLKGVKGLRTINKIADKTSKSIMRATSTPYVPKSNLHKKVVDVNNSIARYYSNPFIFTDNTANSYQLGRKAFGGELGTNGADFTNGIIQINSGGTHEQNPNEGVIFGIDQNGIPNLVEEGEVVFGDYVFSNRIKVPKAVSKRHRLTEGATFADAAKELAKESEERPNDPISKNGLEYLMGDLMTEQEMIRNKSNGNKFPDGGKMTIDDNLFSLSPPDTTVVPPFIDMSKRLSDQDATIRRIWNYRAGQNKQRRLSGNLANLRYIPALGAAIGVTTDSLGLTNKPDYTSADMVLQASSEMGSAPSVRFNPIGNYLAYNPFDREYYINRLNAEAGASRRALANSGMGSGARAAAILAGDNNYLNQLGSLARQSEEYNLAQRQQVEQFNRATNQYNSEGALKADIVNAGNRLKTSNLIIESAIASAKMRQAAKDASNVAKSANLTNLFDNLGNIGWEEYQRNAINSNPGLYYTQDRVGLTGYKRKKGGYLLSRKGRRK